MAIEQSGAMSEAKILTSVQNTLALTNSVLDQIDLLLGEPRDSKVEEAGPIKCPLTEIETDIAKARKNLETACEKLAQINARIW